MRQASLSSLNRWKQYAVFLPSPLLWNWWSKTDFSAPKSPVSYSKHAKLPFRDYAFRWILRTVNSSDIFSIPGSSWAPVLSWYTKPGAAPSPLKFTTTSKPKTASSWRQIPLHVSIILYSPPFYAGERTGNKDPHPCLIAASLDPEHCDHYYLLAGRALWRFGRSYQVFKDAAKTTWGEPHRVSFRRVNGIHHANSAPPGE